MLELFFLSYVVDSQILAKSSSGQVSLGLATTSHKIKGKKKCSTGNSSSSRIQKDVFLRCKSII
jgi:hypothetical protein